MNSSQFRRKLARLGCEFENHKSGSGHVTVRLKERKAVMPTHGGRKQLGTGLVRAILKQLEITSF